MGRRLALLVGPLAAILIYLPTLRHELVFDEGPAGGVERSRCTVHGALEHLDEVAHAAVCGRD